MIIGLVKLCYLKKAMQMEDSIVSQFFSRLETVRIFESAK